MKIPLFLCGKIGAAASLATAAALAAGCAGGVDYGYAGPYEAPVVGVDAGPYFYGDVHFHDHDVHAFHDRGSRSHGFAHGGRR